MKLRRSKLQSKMPKYDNSKFSTDLKMTKVFSILENMKLVVVFHAEVSTFPVLVFTIEHNILLTYHAKLILHEIVIIWIKVHTLCIFVSKSYFSGIVVHNKICLYLFSNHVLFIGQYWENLFLGTVFAIKSIYARICLFSVVHWKNNFFKALFIIFSLFFLSYHISRPYEENIQVKAP